MYFFEDCFKKLARKKPQELVNSVAHSNTIVWLCFASTYLARKKKKIFFFRFLNSKEKFINFDV